MAIPEKVSGYGNNANRKVFGLSFSQSLSAAVKYEAYDSNGTWPAVGTATTTNNECFDSGTKPWYCLVDTTNAAPGATWATGLTKVAGSANPNRLQGAVAYVTQAGANRVGNASPDDNSRITWNMVAEIPSTAAPNSAKTQIDLFVRYLFTGPTPALQWQYNTGTEGSPSWQNMTPGTHGVQHTKSGVVAGGPYEMTVPASSSSFTAEAWITG